MSLYFSKKKKKEMHGEFVETVIVIFRTDVQVRAQKW